MLNFLRYIVPSKYNIEYETIKIGKTLENLNCIIELKELTPKRRRYIWKLIEEVEFNLHLCNKLIDRLE